MAVASKNSVILDIGVWSIDNGENDDKPWHLGPSFEAYISTYYSTY